MPHIRSESYYPTNRTVFTFNGGGWHTHQTSDGFGNYYHAWFDYENFTFTFPVPATSYYLYGIPDTGSGYIQYAICSDCDPSMDKYQTFDTASMMKYHSVHETALLYSNSWSSLGIHKVHVWSPPGSMGITVHRIEINVPVPEEPPKSFSVGSFAGAVTGSLLAGLLIGAIAVWHLMRARGTKVPGHRSGIDPVSPGDEVSGEDSITAKGDLEGGPSPTNDHDGGLPKANSPSVAMDIGYKGLPEPADPDGVEPGARIVPKPVSYIVHGRGQSADGHESVSRPGSASVGPVLEPIRETGAKVNYRGLPESSG